jgi:hypothetical protein
VVLNVMFFPSTTNKGASWQYALSIAVS